VSCLAAEEGRFDIVPSATRSKMMAAVGQSGTAPELMVRSIAREAGLFYRVKNRDLPGSPDLANRTRRWAIFVNGCFWHGHKNCTKTKSGSSPRIPRTNAEFWRDKLLANRSRDAVAIRALRSRGFRVLVIWECELQRPDLVWKRVTRLASLTQPKRRPSQEPT